MRKFNELKITDVSLTDNVQLWGHLKKKSKGYNVNRKTKQYFILVSASTSIMSLVFISFAFFPPTPVYVIVKLNISASYNIELIYDSFVMHSYTSIQSFQFLIARKFRLSVQFV